MGIRQIRDVLLKFLMIYLSGRSEIMERPVRWQLPIGFKFLILHSENQLMILVTGGTGIVGAQVLFDLTSAGKKVRALRRPSSQLSIVNMVFDQNRDLLRNIEWVEGSVTDVFDVAEALKEVDEVYHCAAKVSFHPDDSQEIMRVNVGGTANMGNIEIGRAHV